MRKNNFKRLAVCLSLVAVSISMVAQDAPVNSQNPTTVYSASDDIVDNSDKVTVGYGSLDYYNFDNGFTNLNYWGFTLGAFSYTGGGMELKMKTCFDSEPGSGCGVDLLLNYSVGLTRKNDNMLCLHAKAGPSLMWWTKYKPGKYIGIESDGHKFTVDCVLSLGLIGRVGKFAVSGGYNWWFNKFKFKEENMVDGLWVSVAYCMNSK
ncbi:MAG: hypothetical protein IKJ42_05475 [Bacteroidaceae bacterium]|nr:hypothetical protein [Bacteroidaceae bacterium]